MDYGSGLHIANWKTLVWDLRDYYLTKDSDHFHVLYWYQFTLGTNQNQLLSSCFRTSKSSSGSGRQRHFYDEVQLELLEAEFARDPFSNREGRRRIAHGGFRIAVDVPANLDLQEPQLQLAKQIANVVDHRLTFLVNVNKILTTPLKFYSHQPAVPATVEPINYSTSESSSSSPLQSEWLATSCPQDVVSPQSNYNNSNGSRTDQQPQQQDYSSYYWNNWDYSPPFYPTTMTNSNFFSNTVPDPYSSSYSYYSPEITNPETHY
ncbi:hypothetical protein DAPPUDRAFT_253420 [Daphnia pulex]|uniref:Uncharacterized protein n=1 Tax=Daphnia pulex TaxID=6669 RepID=E9H4S9_DAPPU|nr:hypothetical protein DAPPUDRAFT_253420 [Daphnia pulex]|eukprot:EFX73305.1 hypothetical protein DAPPUDRAFT_253420 [Daphnia pulex]